MIKSVPTTCAAVGAITRRVAALALLVLAVNQAHAQTTTTSVVDGTTPLGLSRGAPAGSYPLSGFESVNLYNGNLNFRLPLLQIGGRGSANTVSMLALNTKGWHVKHLSHTVGGETIESFSPSTQGAAPSSVSYGPGTLSARQSGIFPNLCQFGAPPKYLRTLTRLTFRAADGTEYDLRDQQTGGRPLPTVSCTVGASRGTIFVSANGEAATFIADLPIVDKVSPSGAGTVNCSGFLSLRDGTRYRIDGGLVTWIRDRNGNRLSFTYGTDPNDLESLNRVISITDSLNRQVTIQYKQTDQTYGLVDRISFKGFGGASRTISIACYGNLSSFFRPTTPPYSTQTLQQLFPELNGAPTAYDPAVVSAIYLPDGRSFQFRYNPYGEVEQVVLPTGGSIEYRMADGSGAYPTYADAGNYQIFRRIAERHVYLDANNAASLECKTVYDAAFSTPFDPRPWTTTVTVDSFNSSNARLARSKHYFARSGLAGLFQYVANFYPAADEGQETKTEFFDTNGTTLLRRTTNTFAQRDSVWWWPAYANEQHLNLEDEPGLDERLIVTQTKLDPAGSNQVSKQEYDYDQYNNKTVTREYDFGTGSPGALLRRVEVDYLTTLGGDNYATDTDIHMRGLATSEQVYAGSSSIPSAETQYEYDNYNQNTSDVFHAQLMHRSGISGLDGSFTTNHHTRGNITKTTRAVAFDSNGNVTNSISAYTQYDIAGNLVKALDSRSTATNIIATTFDFSDRFGAPDGEARANAPPAQLGSQTSYAFPTLVTNALGHAAYAQYDYHLGRAVDAEDANQIKASGFYGDPLDRPTEIRSDVIGGLAYSKTRFIYDDLNRRVTTESDQITVGDFAQQSLIKYDGLGRTIRQATYEGDTGSANTWAIVDTQFDGLGRAKQVSNPFRDPDPLNAVAPSGTWTITAYDALSRVLNITSPDNAVVSTGYDGARVLVTDQASKQRISKTDGLGRLTDAWEIRTTDAVTGTEPVTFPNHPEVAAGYRTRYSYDALDDLTQVTQQIGTGGTMQTRTFGYDGLKRLTSAFNPESGTVSYTYDKNSNLQTKTDSRVPAVTTTYVYDDLSRITSRAYSDTTPAVAYKYDAQQLPAGAPGAGEFDRGHSTGRLVAVTYGGTSAGNYTGYDRIGRANVSLQQTETQTDTQNYRFTYAYNLASELTTETYPSGRAITSAHDVAGRLSQLSGTKTGEQPKTYASQFNYEAHGAVAAMQLGNGRWEHTSFNNRLQPILIGLGTSISDSSVLRLDYGYGTTNNNGNVVTQKLTAPGLTLNQCYGYDPLNRLLTAEERSGGTNCAGTQQWKQAFTYDRYGNRNFDVANTTTNVLGPNPAINPGTNRFAAGQNYGYDGAGNLRSDPATATNGIAYDAENRQTQYTKTGQQTNYYFYDGDGHRVKKIDNSGTTVFVYNVSGQLKAEYTSGTPSGGGTSYLTSDHLGSTRVVMKSDGSVARHDYLPFGEEIVSTIGGRGSVAGYGAPDGTRQRFTQKERDNESGLDYFLARYYSPTVGRFTSPDKPLAAHENDPQSWNLYQYARCNPLRYVDPTGEDYVLYEYNKDGKVINTYQVLDIAALGKGYTVYGGNEDGSILHVQGPNGNLFTAQYVTGDPGGMNVQAQYETSAIAEGVGFEMNRREAASLTALGVIGAFNLAPAILASATLSGGSIATLGPLATKLAGPATAAGGVLSQLSRTDAAIFQKAAQYGASATNNFMNNLGALAQAVRDIAPAGQVNQIGQMGNSPVWGSVRSRVGIADVNGVTMVVKMIGDTAKVLGPLP